MITSLIMTDVEIRINFKDFGKHPFTSLSPGEYHVFVEKTNAKLRSKQTAVSQQHSFEPIAAQKPIQESLPIEVENSKQT